MRTIICTDLDEFNEINDRIHQGLQADVRGYNAERWATPLVHPEDGRIALVVEDRVFRYLNQNDIDRIVTLSEDWFPEVKEI